MDLTEALGLKRELESIFTTRRRGPQRRKFALGVATPTETAGYRIAVRTPTEEDLPEKTRAYIRRRAKDEVDERVIGPIGPLAAHALAINRGVAIGASVAHRRYPCAGTLGFFAQRKSDGVLGFVSNNHVIAAEDRGVENDDILHPAPADGKRSQKVIGHLVGGYPTLRRTSALVDCAFARLADGIPYDSAILDAGNRLRVAPEIPHAIPDVCKIGRTTGLSYGRISAFDVGPEVTYGFGSVKFKQQIEIDSVSDIPFSLSGDSGSLVFTKDFQPVALVFAASTIGGYRNCGLTYANPIGSVLDALGVTLLP